MAFEVVWPQATLNQLREIHDYIALDNSSAADRVVDSIIARTEQFRGTPFIGARYPEAHDPRVRQTVVGRYRIFYRVYEDHQEVRILCVWRGSRREPKLPVYDE